MLFEFIIILIVNFSCTRDLKKVTIGVLMKTDSDFSAMSAKQMIYEALNLTCVLLQIICLSCILQNKS